MPLARAAMHAKQETLHVAQWPMVKEMNLVADTDGHYSRPDVFRLEVNSQPLTSI